MHLLCYCIGTPISSSYSWKIVESWKTIWRVMRVKKKRNFQNSKITNNFLVSITFFLSSFFYKIFMDLFFLEILFFHKIDKNIFFPGHFSIQFFSIDIFFKMSKSSMSCKKLKYLFKRFVEIICKSSSYMY